MNKENKNEIPNVMKETYIEYLLKIGNELQIFIFGGVDSKSGDVVKGFGARPTQQSKDPIVRNYGKKINKLQMVGKQLKNLVEEGNELTENQQKVIDILDNINSTYPPQIRLDDKASAQLVYDYIYGKIDSNTGVQTEGIHRRPNSKSNDEVERSMGSRIQKLTIKCEKLLKRMDAKQQLTDNELEFLKIMAIMNRDYPKAHSARKVGQIMHELETKVRGYYNENHEWVKGIERRPNITKEPQIETDWHFMNKWAKKIRSKIEQGENISYEEMDVLNRIDKLNKDYPSRDIYSWLESAHILKDYIYGTNSKNVDGEHNKGLNRRPTHESKDKTERLMASRLTNLCNYGREVKNAYKNGNSISVEDKEIMSILYRIYIDFPARDITATLKKIQDFVYGYKDENGIWFEGKNKRPNVQSADIIEKKAGQCLAVITNRVRNLTNDLSVVVGTGKNRIIVLKPNVEEKLNNEDYMCMQMLRQLDKDYPSQKSANNRINALRFADAVFENNLGNCRNRDYITEAFEKEQHAARNYLIDER